MAYGRSSSSLITSLSSSSTQQAPASHDDEKTFRESLDFLRFDPAGLHGIARMLGLDKLLQELSERKNLGKAKNTQSQSDKMEIDADSSSDQKQENPVVDDPASLREKFVQAFESSLKPKGSEEVKSSPLRKIYDEFRDNTMRLHLEYGLHHYRLDQSEGEDISLYEEKLRKVVQKYVNGGDYGSSDDFRPVNLKGRLWKGAFYFIPKDQKWFEDGLSNNHSSLSLLDLWRKANPERVGKALSSSDSFCSLISSEEMINNTYDYDVLEQLVSQLPKVIQEANRASLAACKLAFMFHSRGKYYYHMRDHYLIIAEKIYRDLGFSLPILGSAIAETFIGTGIETGKMRYLTHGPSWFYGPASTTGYIPAVAAYQRVVKPESTKKRPAEKSMGQLEQESMVVAKKPKIKKSEERSTPTSEASDVLKLESKTRGVSASAAPSPLIKQVDDLKFHIQSLETLSNMLQKHHIESTIAVLNEYPQNINDELNRAVQELAVLSNPLKRDLELGLLRTNLSKKHVIVHKEDKLDKMSVQYELVVSKDNDGYIAQLHKEFDEGIAQLNIDSDNSVLVLRLCLMACKFGFHYLECGLDPTGEKLNKAVAYFNKATEIHKVYGGNAFNVGAGIAATCLAQMARPYQAHRLYQYALRCGYAPALVIFDQKLRDDHTRIFGILPADAGKSSAFSSSKPKSSSSSSSSSASPSTSVSPSSASHPGPSLGQVKLNGTYQQLRAYALQLTEQLNSLREKHAKCLVKARMG